MLHLCLFNPGWVYLMLAEVLLESGKDGVEDVGPLESSWGDFTQPGFIPSILGSTSDSLGGSCAELQNRHCLRCLGELDVSSQLSWTPKLLVETHHFCTRSGEMPPYSEEGDSNHEMGFGGFLVNGLEFLIFMGSVMWLLEILKFQVWSMDVERPLHYQKVKI